MAVVLNDATLVQVGLGGLSPREKKTILDRIRQVLQLRVGARQAAALTDEQLAVFDQVVNEGDSRALAWLETNVPNYRAIVSQELDTILDSISEAIRRDVPPLGPADRAEQVEQADRK